MAAAPTTTGLSESITYMNNGIKITIILVALFLIIKFFIALYNINYFNLKREEIVELLNSLPDFKPTQKFIDTYLNCGIAIDEIRNKICLIIIANKGIGQPISTKIIPYKDIISVELFKNGISITKTVRSSQIGGAVIGGLLLGGTGAIIGGLSGKTETTGKVNHIDLRLIVNDVKNPLHDVIFLSKEESESMYKKKMQLARHWHGVIEVVIKRADEEEKKLQVIKQEKPEITPQYSIADEVKKLADLHSSGILTLEEFQQQKAKLLGIDTPKPIEPEQTKPETKICTKCNTPMQIRTVTKGEQQGKKFYVCSNYPNCRETIKIDSA